MALEDSVFRVRGWAVLTWCYGGDHVAWCSTWQRSPDVVLGVAGVDAGRGVDKLGDGPRGFDAGDGGTLFDSQERGDGAVDLDSDGPERSAEMRREAMVEVREEARRGGVIGLRGRGG